jgi:hypothetical protein
MKYSFNSHIFINNSDDLVYGDSYLKSIIKLSFLQKQSVKDKEMGAFEPKPGSVFVLKKHAGMNSYSNFTTSD